MYIIIIDKGEATYYVCQNCYYISERRYDIGIHDCADHSYADITSGFDIYAEGNAMILVNRYHYLKKLELTIG